MALTSRIQSLIDSLTTDLVEREQHVKLMLLAALAGEHVLLIGPPGTAKSLLARRLTGAFRSATYFERLLTQFSIPEDLFGPYSLGDLEEGRYLRLTDGYLPSADVAFLDEVFKSNPSILNSLLTVLHERVFHNVRPRDESGNSSDNAPHPLPIPLKCLVGASNEVPPPGELDALYDRFLVRCEVDYVKDFRSLITRVNVAPSGADRNANMCGDDIALDADEWLAIRTAAQEMPINGHVAAILTALRSRAAELRLDVSDRRWVKIRDLLRVAAYINGRDSISPVDVLLAPYCMWSPSRKQDKEDTTQASLSVIIELQQFLFERLWDADPEGTPGRLDVDVEAWQTKCEQITASDENSRGRTDAHKVGAEDCRKRVAEHYEALRRERSHLDHFTPLWLSADVFERAVKSLENAIEATDLILQRISQVISGFESLEVATSGDDNSKSLEAPQWLDFSLPGVWSSRNEHEDVWQELVGTPELESEVPWDDRHRYSFRFKPPATEVNLVRLMRDYGRSKQLVELSLGGTSVPGSKVSDLSALGVCHSLESLDISRSQVNDLRPIEVLISLKYLNCRLTPVENLHPLAALPALRKLSLIETKIKEITPLTEVPSLTHLWLEGISTLSDIQLFRKMTWLRHISLSQTPVRDWSPLEHLKQAETLRLDEVEIASLLPLRSMRVLQKLHLVGATGFSVLDGAEGLLNLRELDLTDTGVFDLSPLAGLRLLKKLVLKGTQVNCLKPLQGLMCLDSLDLGNTRVSNLAPLVPLTGLRILNLKGIPNLSAPDVASLQMALPNCKIQVL